MFTIHETRVFRQNSTAWLAGKRRALNEGGTRSSKTFSILQLLIVIALHSRRKLLISVVSESLPHLKRGCIRDFKEILADDFNEAKFNKTDQIYTGLGKSTIEFFSADEPAKMRGAGRDILFINEANNVAYDAYRELDVRTRLFTFLDWNPVAEFWAHENLMGKPENAYVHSTYKDALRVLPPEVVKNIESNKNDPNWWHVYGEGLVGKVVGLVYPSFEQVDEMPDAGEESYGLDFGYSNDPTVLVRNLIINNPDPEIGLQLFSDELIYRTGMTNPEIAEAMKECGVKVNFDEIFADSSEPKSIDEIHGYGFNIKGAVKGPGSVEFGHQKIRQFKQYWTKRSLNCIKEQRNFKYIEDKNGKLTDKTTHQWSHGMDARRYGVAQLQNSFETWQKALSGKKAAQEDQGGQDHKWHPTKPICTVCGLTEKEINRRGLKKCQA